MNRKKREFEKECKEQEKFWKHCERACKQHGLTAEEYFDKFYKSNCEPYDFDF